MNSRSSSKKSPTAVELGGASVAQRYARTVRGRNDWCKRLDYWFVQCTVFIQRVTIACVLVDISRDKTFRTMSVKAIVHKIKHAVSEMCLHTCAGFCYLLVATLSVNGNSNCSYDAHRLGGPCVSVLTRARLIVHIIGAPNVTPDLRSVAT